MNNDKKHTKGVSVMNGKTKNLSQEKFEFVKDLYIVKSMRYTDVVNAFVRKYGDSERGARNYITKVKKALQETQDDKLGYHMQSALIRYNDLYNKAYNAEKWADCAAIQDKINKLTGLDVKRFEINQNVNTTTVDANKLLQQLSPEMIAQLAAGLGAQHKTIDITPESVY
ncbi:hypothetical protein EFA69_06420 [Rufibacter immobilis]|uniref:Terminase small subunit n=1 Tax=Rufibacter immobilis TaxID=1348778 RepID=A0A3M9MZE7_9BACT|nr:hypothetical protein [Rufibacter immobilis]RNI30921.1 hypothetical protein EFA69_06420 [Rufibacter immobilis]